MKLNTILFAIAFLVISILSGCNNDYSDTQTTSSKAPNDVTVNSANETFAKILAKSLVDKEVRAFIKEKSLMQVDKDYDVIYHLIKQ